MSEDRRKFLKRGAGALAGAVLVMMIPKPLRAGEEEEKEDGKPYDWKKHYWAYVIDTTKCIGCGNCVKACKKENNVAEEFFRTWVERYTSTEREHINDHVYVDSENGGHDSFKPKKVEGKVTKTFFVPKMCNHCRKAPCVQVCPVHASYYAPDGTVLVDRETCIGCGYCVQACPYGSRYMDRTHTADKCTWCYHRIHKGLLPACVTLCPTQTRTFGDTMEEDSEIKDILNNERLAVLKQELRTEPFCFYIGYDQIIR